MLLRNASGGWRLMDWSDQMLTEQVARLACEERERQVEQAEGLLASQKRALQALTLTLTLTLTLALARSEERPGG